MRKNPLAAFEIQEKKIKNYSLQGLTLIFSTPNGFKNKYVKPNEIVTVPESWITGQVRTLHSRRMIKIYN
jgi:hypothetical protein